MYTVMTLTGDTVAVFESAAVALEAMRSGEYDVIDIWSDVILVEVL